ncbi:hypothetical protein Barb4_01450 [Bacteroidales bacterium Barb4]|nr:hypothetical protein Barb4_01450 [Bacteroidales bacterium Barb4]
MKKAIFTAVVLAVAVLMTGCNYKPADQVSRYDDVTTQSEIDLLLVRVKGDSVNRSTYGYSVTMEAYGILNGNLYGDIRYATGKIESENYASTKNIIGIERSDVQAFLTTH